jgi:hypothetical protein
MTQKIRVTGFIELDALNPGEEDLTSETGLTADAYDNLTGDLDGLGITDIDVLLVYSEEDDL